MKGDLLQGNGKTWPADVREVYVRVRTGIKELVELLFSAPGEPPMVYARDRLSVYHNHIYSTVTRLAKTCSTVP